MIRIQKFQNLGGMKLNWLDAHYHFSFFQYHNPDRMNFGKLRVINDDIVKANSGFDTHHHENMEIITYVRQGAITHKDSQGNEGVTQAGDLQVMSAGTGIDHSEFNLQNEDATMYQIWIEPREDGLEPKWDKEEFPKSIYENELPLLVSGRKEDDKKDILHINQDASIYGGKIKEGAKIKHEIKGQIYILVSDGEIEINGQKINKGDGCEVVDEENIEILAIEKSEILIIDVPK